VSGDIDGPFSEIAAAEQIDNVELILALYEDPPATSLDDGPAPLNRLAFKHRVALGCIGLILIGWLVTLVLIVVTTISAL
jgi:hypothetical protein